MAHLASTGQNHCAEVLVGRPHADLAARGFDDRAASAAAACAGVTVSPLSAAYIARPAAHGLLLGYAATAPEAIEAAAERLRSALELQL